MENRRRGIYNLSKKEISLIFAFIFFMLTLWTIYILTDINLNYQIINIVSAAY